MAARPDRRKRPDATETRPPLPTATAPQHTDSQGNPWGRGGPGHQTTGPPLAASRLHKLRDTERTTLNTHQETTLADAYHRRDWAQVHRLARLRAGRGVGVRNRDYRSLPSSRPTTTEWADYYRQNGDEGGLAATEFTPAACLRENDEEFLSRMRQLPTPPPPTTPLTLQHCEQGRRNVEQTIAHLIQAPRGKSS